MNRPSWSLRPSKTEALDRLWSGQEPHPAKVGQPILAAAAFQAALALDPAASYTLTTGQGDWRTMEYV